MSTSPDTQAVVLVSAEWDGGMSDVPGSANGAGHLLHPALFYRDCQEYLDGTVPFVLEGLSAGEPVAVAVPELKLRLLRRQLGSAAARVRFLNMNVVGRNPGSIIPGVLRPFMDAHPGARVRIVGEPVWPGRSATEYPACAQHEALINLAFTERAVTLLCPYDATNLDPAVLTDATATHPWLVDADGWRRSDGYAPHRVISSCNRRLPEPPETAATLTVNRGGLAAARAFTAGHAHRLGLAGERVEDAVLAVAELTANSVAHGGGSGVLRMWREDDFFVLQVSDAGHIRDPLAGRSPARPFQPGGHGLLVVNHVADLVLTHTSECGTTTRVYLR